MISKYNVKYFVREGELEKIENYDKAVADKTHTWHCHHRLELTLDGEFAHSKEELKRLSMYYNRPYFELIFLTSAEHKKLHRKAQSDDTKKKIVKALKVRKLREETKKKVGEAQKNKPKHNSDFGKKYFEYYGYSKTENPKQYNRERMWYLKHNKRCRWK